jgi:hypothetical protein
MAIPSSPGIQVSLPSMDSEVAGRQDTPPSVERKTLCMPDFEADLVLHHGHDRFPATSRRYFEAFENNAAEQLIQVKNRLRHADTSDFWDILLRSLCAMTGAQSSFVTKRLLVDPDDGTTPLPSLGEPGACFVAVAFYLDDGSESGQLHRDYKYAAQGT